MIDLADVTLLDAIGVGLREEMARDANVVLLGERIADRRDNGVAVSQALLSEFGAGRVIDLPMSEGALVGAAVGAALMGLRPVVEMPSADRLAGALAQIAGMTAPLFWRSGGAMHAPLVLRVPYGGGPGDGPWSAASPEAWLARVPGLKVVMPATPYDARGLIKSAIRDNNPVVMLEHRYLYRRLHEPLPAGEYTVPLESAEVRRAGEQVTILTYGALIYAALEAAEMLATEGVSAEVLDLRSLAPLDHDAIATSVSHTNRALIAHEDALTGGLGAEIAALIAERHFTALDAPVTRIAALDTLVPLAAPLADAHLPNAERIAAAARRLVAF